MKKIYFLFLLATTFAANAVDVSLTDLNGKAYGEQLKNSTFEMWDNSATKEIEPQNWNSFMTAYCTMATTFCNMGKGQRVDKSTEKRVGTSGNNSVKIWSTNAVVTIANGNVTTGKIHMGSTTATNASNYNYTDRSDPNHNMLFEDIPDSMTVWVRYKPKNADEARIHAVIHTDNDYRDPEDAASEAYVVADATLNFATTNGLWVRKTIKFVDGFATTPKYILVSMTSNKTPGRGSADDAIYVDDFLMIYNPTLSLGTLSSSTLYGGSTIDIPFTLEGTMSPYNFNKDANVVIAELSDASGSFTDAVELGQLQTNVSGNVRATIPSNLHGTSGYRIRVRSTNYPMTSNDNGSDLTVIGPYTITLPTSTDGYTIAAEAGSNSPVIHGGNYSFKVNLNASHNQSTPVVKIDGNPINAVGGVYTISNVTAAHTVTVENVVINKYPVTYTQPVGGTISVKNGGNDVAGGTNVDHGTVLTISATPSVGYTFSSLKVNNVDFTSGNNHTVTADVNVTASFTLDEYSITYYDGKGTNTNPTKYNVTSSTITLGNLSADGYTFDGWFSDAVKTIPATPITLGTTGHKKFWAKWTPIEYTITYHLDGGTHSNTATKYTIETNDITLLSASKDCYTFEGWYKNSLSGEKVEKITKGTWENFDLYAKFTLNHYTVTVTNSNSLAGNILQGDGTHSNVACGSTITLEVEELDNTIYTFSGWYSGATLLSSSLTYTHPVKKSETITPKFSSAGTYLVNVTLSNENAGTIEAEGLTDGSGLFDDENSCTITVNIKPGYKFLRWELVNVLFSESTEITVNKDNANNYTVNLTAIFETIPYTIVYENTFDIDITDLPTGYNVETPTFNLDNSLSRIGYTFDGWFDATNTKVTQITKGSYGNKILTAKWTLLTYNITYNNVDDTTNPNLATYNITQTPLTLQKASKTGYTFAGWFTESTFGTQVTQIAANSTGNQALYAKWILNTYTITYHNVPIGVTNSNRNSYNVKDYISPLVNLVQNYYTFDGWYADAEFTTSVSGITNGTGNIDIYAKWTPVTYNITYNNIENATNSNVSSYNVETAVTLSDATKTGYKFEGWFTEETFQNKVTEITVGLNGNKTFWAKWNVVTYSINYENVEDLYNPKNYTVETETITLQPVEKEFHTFDGWFTNADFTGAAVTEITKGSVGDLDFYAKLTINSYKISVTANNSSAGTLVGSGIYNHGSPVTVTATANSGYKFIGWTENKEIVKNAQASYTFTAERERNLVANFNLVSSVKEFAPDGLVAYAKDGQIIVRFTNEVDPEVSVYLFNITGNLLSVKPCDSQELSFTVSAVGLYFVQVGNRTVKVVVR